MSNVESWNQDTLNKFSLLFIRPYAIGFMRLASLTPIAGRFIPPF